MTVHKTLRRVRWAVRFTLTLGVAASVAANILHATDNLISQTIAAWPPLALLVTIELISRVPVHRRSLALVRLVATATIASIAAWVSYWHMVGVIARYGETGAGPYLVPLTVDGLIVVASICLVELAGRIRDLDIPAVATPPPAPATVNTMAAPAATTPRAPRKTATSAKKTTPTKKTAPVKKAAPAKTAAATSAVAAAASTVDSKAAPEPRPAMDTAPLPAHLLPTARFSATNHHQNTGRPITPAELAARLSIPDDTARRLLLALTDQPATPAVMAVNGTPVRQTVP